MRERKRESVQERETSRVVVSLSFFFSDPVFSERERVTSLTGPTQIQNANGGSSSKNTPSRRRTLSSSPTCTGGGRLKKRPRFCRSKSYDEESLKKDFPTSSHVLRSTKSFDDASIVSYFSSPRGGDSKKRSPPPSEKLRKLMARFNIDTPRSSEHHHHRSITARSHNSTAKAARKLTLLSQLPKSDQQLETSSIEFVTPPGSANSSFVAQATPDQEENNDNAVFTTPSTRLDIASKETYNSCSSGMMMFSFVDQSGDVSEPVIPDWVSSSSNSSDKDEAFVFSSSSVKQHFPVCKSPYRSNSTINTSSNNISALPSPCSFLSSSMTPIRNDTMMRSVDSERTPSLRNVLSSCRKQEECERTPSFRVSQKHQAVSSCRKETQEERELTPSNAKLKIIPQRPSKVGARRNLRRQRSLRMQQQFPCRSASKPSNSRIQRNFTRPATISDLSSCMTASSCPKWDGSEAAMCDLVKRMRRAGVRSKFSYTSQITLTRNTRNTTDTCACNRLGSNFYQVSHKESMVRKCIGTTKSHSSYDMCTRSSCTQRGTSRQHRNLLRTDLLDSRSFGYRVPKYYTIDKTFRNKRKLRHMVSVCKIVRQFFRAGQI